MPHPPFGLPPCVSKRRLAALSRCPDADGILPASAIRWNGTKVWNVIHRDLVSKISGQNKTQGSPRHTTPFESRGPLSCKSDNLTCEALVLAAALVPAMYITLRAGRYSTLQPACPYLVSPLG